MRVRVYFNLHKKILSVQNKQTGRVIGHASALTLENVKFVVQKGGRARVLREKQKNIHAFVEGDLLAASVISPGNYGRKEMVGYNPYRSGNFCVKDWHGLMTEMPVSGAALVTITGQSTGATIIAYDPTFFPAN